MPVNQKLLFSGFVCFRFCLIVFVVFLIIASKTGLFFYRLLFSLLRREKLLVFYENICSHFNSMRARRAAPSSSTPPPHTKKTNTAQHCSVFSVPDRAFFV
eukprot:GEMP01023689.1.p2 GENE.GEMP01023689.1~~GEMP01023689.1.p2  ORF type:complete len:101 (+),score=5.85 GEMP01023689.1:1545-1847(+)